MQEDSSESVNLLDLSKIPADEREKVWFEKYYQGNVPQFTARAVIMGGLIGMLMAISNLYTTLKLGWSFGVAITACVISYVVWNGLLSMRIARSQMTMLENNCMQSTASAAGSSTGGTLATAVGAMLLITGDAERMGWVPVACWVFLVAMLGVFLAIPMKRQMINVDQLPFPSGIAAAETLRSLYAHGQEAMQKARPILLEPVINVSVFVPDQYMGDITGNWFGSNYQDVYAFLVLVAVLVLLVSFLIGHVADGSTYLWLLPMVTLASAALVGVVVHPWAHGARAVFGSRPLVEVGKRSYGLYLWTWPVSRIADAYTGSWVRFVGAMLIAVPLSEACYRFIETPVRKGALRRWLGDRSAPQWGMFTACAALSTLAIVVPVARFYQSAPATFDAAVDSGGSGVVFDPNALSTVPSTEPPTQSSSSPAGVVIPTTPVAPSTPITAARLPRRLVIVGDSMAHSLKVNLPAGIEGTFSVTDGSVEGCSVYDSGKAVSSRDGYSRSFSGCAGWDAKWTAAAQKGSAEVALVVLGAWDVFDVVADGRTLPFGTAENDQRFTAGLQHGIDALTAAGVV